ncbi:hypothetical protein [Hymenobacter rubidus]|uniref:hypothetical protein n=1 Tax=Hymenobacter rubidus TaxID=1441626 RepID=UPI00191FFCB7|nr:hypothetical protein [Hymenobacter rubidus]
MQPAFPALPVVDYLQCQYRPDLQVLVGRWLRQPTDEELRAGYFRLLEQAEAVGARLWLIDTRRRDNATKQSTPWMMEHFMPLLPQRLHGPVFLAYLFMPTHLYEIEQDQTVPPLTYFDGRAYHVQRFTEEHTAMEWLRVCRTREADGPAPALL